MYVILLITLNAVNIPKTFILLVVFFLLVTCDSPKSKIKGTEGKKHPKETFIEYYDGKDKYSVGKDRKRDGLIKDIREGEVRYNKTSIFVEGARHVSVERDTFGNIFVLDERNNKLYRYDVSDSTYSVLADNTPGPKSISGAVGLDIHNKNVYVSTRKMKILEYYCNAEGCEYRDTNTLNFMPRSIAVTDDKLYTLGFAFSDEIDKQKFESIIQEIENGKVENSFGKAYNSKNPIVTFKMNRGPLEEICNGKLLFSLRDTPYIRKFSEGKMNSLYEISNFKLPTYREGSNPPSLTINQSTSASTILEISAIGNKKAVVSVLERSWDREFSKKRPRKVHKQSIKYYLIEPGSKEHSYLGRVKGNINEMPYVLFNTGKPVVVENGRIYLAEYD